MERLLDLRRTNPAQFDRVTNPELRLRTALYKEFRDAANRPDTAA